MIMGNVMSRLAMILRGKRVTPDQIDVLQTTSGHETRCNERERPKEMYSAEVQQGLTSTSNIEASPVEKRHEVPNVTDPLDMVEESFQRTTTNDLDMNSQSVKNDPRRFHASQQDSEMMVASNECKSAQKGEIFCGSDQDNEVRSRAASFIEDNGDQQNQLSDISAENTLNIDSKSYPSDSSSKIDCPSQDIGRHGENLDTLSWITNDGYSTEGTLGSGSFGDRDDDIIDRLLVDNIDDLGMNFQNFDQVSNDRKSALTPLSLETLNSSEVDRRECVRSYLEAWSPLNLPNSGSYSNSLPGACVDIEPVKSTSSESYDGFRSIYEDVRVSLNESRDAHEVDSQELRIFYQCEREPLSRPLSDNWDLLKNDRAPWINIGSTGSEEVIQGRGGLIGDNQDSSWPKANADAWQDPHKGLTICSLSTINEESDDANRTEQ